MAIAFFKNSTLVPTPEKYFQKMNHSFRKLESLAFPTILNEITTIAFPTILPILLRNLSFVWAIKTSNEGSHIFLAENEFKKRIFLTGGSSETKRIFTDLKVNTKVDCQPSPHFETASLN